MHNEKKQNRTQKNAETSIKVNRPTNNIERRFQKQYKRRTGHKQILKPAMRSTVNHNNIELAVTEPRNITQSLHTIKTHAKNVSQTMQRETGYNQIPKKMRSTKEPQ